MQSVTIVCLLQLCSRGVDGLRLSYHGNENSEDRNGAVGELVISAFCRDNLDYIKEINCSLVDVYVYSKCPDQENPNLTSFDMRCVHQKFLYNVGREGETYLYHMHHHYERLQKQRKLLVFLQGGNEWGGGGQAVNDLMKQTMFSKGPGGKRIAFASLHDATCDLRYGCPGKEMLEELYKFYRNVPDYENFWATYRGEFVLSSERMRRVPKWLISYTQYYMDIERGSEAIHGHPMERLWGMLFGCYRPTREPLMHPTCYDACDSMIDETCGPNQDIAWEGRKAPISVDQFVKRILRTGEPQLPGEGPFAPKLEPQLSKTLASEFDSQIDRRGCSSTRPPAIEYIQTAKLGEDDPALALSHFVQSIKKKPMRMKHNKMTYNTVADFESISDFESIQ